jgi:hypothetical protein
LNCGLGVHLLLQPHQAAFQLPHLKLNAPANLLDFGQMRLIPRQLLAKGVKLECELPRLIAVTVGETRLDMPGQNVDRILVRGNAALEGAAIRLGLIEGFVPFPHFIGEAFLCLAQVLL